MASVMLPYDNLGRSQGTAFVTYKNSHDAHLAKADYDGQDNNGFPIQVTMLPTASAAAALLSFKAGDGSQQTYQASTPQPVTSHSLPPQQATIQPATAQSAKKMRRASRPRCPECKQKKVSCDVEYKSTSVPMLMLV